MNKFKIINDLSESAMFPHKSRFSSYNAREIADLIFLYCVSLNILKSDFKYLPIAINYIEKTISWGTFDTYRSNGNDLYLMIHVLFGKRSDLIDNLKDKEASVLLIDRLNFELSEFKSWANRIKSNSSDEDADSRFLLKLQSWLNITTSDYKSVRRLAGDWNIIDQQDRQLAMTRLVFALKSRAPKCELLNSLNKMAEEQKLMIQGARNPEGNPKTSAKAVAATIAVGVAANVLNLGYQINRFAKAGMKPSSVREDAAIGSTTAGSISATPMPLGSTPVISRSGLKQAKRKPKL